MRIVRSAVTSVVAGISAPSVTLLNRYASVLSASTMNRDRYASPSIGVVRATITSSGMGGTNRIARISGLSYHGLTSAPTATSPDNRTARVDRLDSLRSSMNARLV